MRAASPSAWAPTKVGLEIGQDRSADHRASRKTEGENPKHPTRSTMPLELLKAKSASAVLWLIESLSQESEFEVASPFIMPGMMTSSNACCHA
jgi:hypothetical protein